MLVEKPLCYVIVFFIQDIYTETTRHDLNLLESLNLSKICPTPRKVCFFFSLFLMCTCCVCVCVCVWRPLHATIASTNSTVKGRHLSQMLKALRAEASVTSVASGCQRWLKTWEQASVLKILCVGVCAHVSKQQKWHLRGTLQKPPVARDLLYHLKSLCQSLESCHLSGGRYGRGSRLTGRN